MFENGRTLAKFKQFPETVRLQMEPSNPDQPGVNAPSQLNRIETLWSMVRRAHEDDREAASTAQRQLLETYGPAIRRYLVAALGDADQADDLFQEFALQFINGRFASADPNRGRFRAFVKTVLYRMIALHFRKRKASKERNLNQLDQLAWPPEGGEKAQEENWLLSWREEILNRTWTNLAAFQEETGTPYFQVLQTRVEFPQWSSAELANSLGPALGKEISPNGARVLVHRARDKFANLLIEVVSESLPDRKMETLEDELAELRLIVYCRDILEERKNSMKME